MNPTRNAEEWRTPEFRGRLVGQLEILIQRNPVTLSNFSASVLEERIFSQAKTRDEYLQAFKSFASKIPRQPAQQLQPGQGMMPRPEQSQQYIQMGQQPAAVMSSSSGSEEFLRNGENGKKRTLNEENGHELKQKIGTAEQHSTEPNHLGNLSTADHLLPLNSGPDCKRTKTDFLYIPADPNLQKGNGIRGHDSHQTLHFADLYHELVVIVFRHMDFFTQQRIRRVSRRWMTFALDLQVIRSVYLDASNFSNIFAWDWYIARRPAVLANYRNRADELERLRYNVTEEYWRAAFPDRVWHGIREITFNGLHHPKRTFASMLLRVLCGRCPDFRQLHLRNVIMEEYDGWFNGAQDVDPDYSLTVTNCRFLCWSVPDEPALYRENAPVILPCRVTTADGTLWRSVTLPLSYELPALTVSPPGNLDVHLNALPWLYPDEQLGWLVESAVALANDEAWLGWLRGEMFEKLRYSGDIAADSDFPAMFRTGDAVVIREFLEPLDGKMLIAMAAYIRVWADGRTPLPLDEFDFEDSIALVPIDL